MNAASSPATTDRERRNDLLRFYADAGFRRGNTAAETIAVLTSPGGIPGTDGLRFDEAEARAAVAEVYGADVQHDPAPHFILPSGAVSITDCARNVFPALNPAADPRFFSRGGQAMELRETDGALRLDVLRPEQLCSRIERFGKVLAWRVGRDSEAVLKPTTCPVETADKLLATIEARELLPSVCGVAAAPVIVPDGDRGAKVLRRGYHKERGGILVVGGDAEDVPLSVAVTDLKSLFVDFSFLTSGDFSRALAAFLTVALKTGGWIPGHTPLLIIEADQKQTGKTYQQKIMSSIYRERPYVVAQRQGGVGSVDESFNQAVLGGQPLILFDNLRGVLSSPYIEAFITIGGYIGVRVPHKGEVQVDSRFFTLLATSNGVETTPDLAARSSIVRIRKQTPGYAFRTWPEGDLEAHVRARQAHYLGCIHAVIRAWAEAGRPTTDCSGHDFRSWARSLDYIVQHILGAAPLMEGHEAAQERVSNPALTWLRKVALAVIATGQTDTPLNASQIGELCEDHALDVPGLRDQGDEDQRRRKVGVLMHRVFHAGETVSLDGVTVTRSEEETARSDGSGYVTSRLYRFSRTAALTALTPQPPGKLYRFPESYTLSAVSAEPREEGTL